MNTETIEEAKIVTETKSKQEEDSLHERLAKLTEIKQPGAAIPQKTSSSFWESSEDDFEKPEPAVKTEATKEAAKDESKPVDKKNTEKLKLGSAKTAVGMFDFTGKLLFTPILNYKLKKTFEKKFMEKEMDLLDEKVIEAENTELDQQELKLKKRFESVMKKHAIKINAVPLSDSEKEDLTDAFFNYFDYTETTLSPGWYLAMAITNTMGKRAIDAFTE